MTPEERSGTLFTRRVVWALTTVAAVSLVALLRVPTYLGVKVEEANRNAAVGQGLLDYRGSEYLWRVWWRARGEFVDVSPDWLYGAALLAFLAAFVVGILGAYRLALALPTTPARDA